eukprot:gene8136-7494_t
MCDPLTKSYGAGHALGVVIASGATSAAPGISLLESLLPTQGGLASTVGANTSEIVTGHAAPLVQARALPLDGVVITLSEVYVLEQLCYKQTLRL